MGLSRTYQLTCDRCGLVHVTACASPRRARAVAKHDGWARRKVPYLDRWFDGVRQREGVNYVGRDFCPECLDAMDSESEVTP